MKNKIDWRSKRNHPHTCGEYLYNLSKTHQHLESPPHMWGILVEQKAINEIEGITPTHVGNTTPAVSGGGLFGNHPHTCGEYTPVNSVLTSPLESPPHMWGIPGYSPKAYGELRITPTHVGNTGPWLRLHQSWWNHPHTCGEYSRSPVSTCLGMESPPHMWGIPLVRQLDASWVRITPTHVGNTLKKSHHTGISKFTILGFT